MRGQLYGFLNFGTRLLAYLKERGGAKRRPDQTKFIERGGCCKERSKDNRARLKDQINWTDLTNWKINRIILSTRRYEEEKNA